MRCHRPALAPWHFSLLALLILLASCQGTQFGTVLEEAVAPTTPSQPERPLGPDSLNPEDRVSPDVRGNPEDLPNLDDRLTPNDDNLGSSAPDTSEDPETPTESTEPSEDSQTGTDDTLADDNLSEARGQNRFSDLDVDSQTAEAIAALDRLDVFADIDTEEFQPNRSVRRQEFARWATLAHNALYADDPDRQLSLAGDSETPLFLDVPEDRPEFPHIQALANAGIVEMRADREFEPENLLSRADLIAIKVALDLGVDNLQGTLADVERDWDFSDASDIRAGDIPAIASDFTLGDASNIRRIFGPLEDFEPQAPVTRAQAALALASFGVGDNQRSAIEANAADSSPSENPSPSQSEDGEPPPSTKNPPQSDSLDNIETPDSDPPPDSASPPGDRPDRADPTPEDSGEDGGRFLDL